MFSVERKVKKLPIHKGRVPTVDLDSPTSENVPTSLDINEEQTPSEYESSAEDGFEKPPHTLLAEDPFSSETSRILFDAIDELRKFGAGSDLELPQLVIVGKQSAGKSSLLQSLTDIPFPVGNTLCTRFSTRIVSRRTGPGTEEIVKASIEPGDTSSFGFVPDQAKLNDFEQIIPSMTAEAFETLIEKAKKVMGIDASRGSKSQSFSSMVLKIELTGPKRSHFGILDVPGVFHAPTNKVTEQEMEGVTRMVTEYMKRRENIIICVADANENLANQKILKLAQDLNVDSSRIVGVLTKCDRVEEPSVVLQIVKGGEGIQQKYLRWYVVRNRGPTSPEDFNREQEEMDTFSKDIWRGISQDRCGIPMLKAYLADLLCRRISEAFPAMKDKVERLLQQQKSLRKSFSEPRMEHGERLAFVMGIVNRFQELANKSLNSPWDLPSDDIKLRGLTQTENGKFAKGMTENGILHKFLDIGQEGEGGNDPNASDSDDELPRMDSSPPSMLVFGSPNHTRNPLTPASSPPRSSKPKYTPERVHPLYKEIRKQINTNRGEELPGMLNPAVLKPLWRKQTCKWQDIAEEHLTNIVDITTHIALKIFSLVATNQGLSVRAVNKLETTIQRFSNEGRSRILQQLRDICDKNAKMALQTNNSDFLIKVRAAQIQRFRAAMTRFKRNHPPPHYTGQLTTAGFGGGPAVTITPDNFRAWKFEDNQEIQDLFNEIHPSGSRSRNTEDEIHDILRAYYDISLQNFLHDVLDNIVEPFLESPNGPLLGLSSDYIMKLSESEIEDLGGEDMAVIKGRQESDWQIEKLERAMGIAEDAVRKTRKIAA